MHNIFNNEILQNLDNILNNNLAELKPYKFGNTCAIMCGNVKIVYVNGSVIMDLNNNIDTNYLNKWYSTPIKIICRDLRKNNLDNYYKLEFENVYYLLRKLDDDAIAYLKKKNVKDSTDIKCGNDLYAIISIASDERFSQMYGVNKYEIEVKDDADELDEIVEEEVSLELFDESDLYY